MRRSLGASAICTVLAVSAAMIGSNTGATADTSGAQCLRFRDLQNLTKIDDRTLLASTRSGTKKYTVNLRQECHDFGRPGNFYTVRLHSDWECLDRDDVLVFHDGGSCFIDSVTLAPPRKPS